jgi:hypothetical protein
MTINPGDNVTINAKVVDITSSGNLIVKFKKGNRVLVCPDELNTAYDPIKKIMETAGIMYTEGEISEGSYNDIVDILKGVINDSV